MKHRGMLGSSIRPKEHREGRGQIEFTSLPGHEGVKDVEEAIGSGDLMQDR